MTQFHKGQEVEVRLMTSAGRNGKTFSWRKAKIDADILGRGLSYQVQFTDGTSAVLGGDHIRPERQYRGR